MRQMASINNLSKKIFRAYQSALLTRLKERGFDDLRPSYFELMRFIAEHPGSNIKTIGDFCGLKKQTMTSHLNELQGRGYISRKVSPEDRREQIIELTDLGQKFKLSLFESLEDLEGYYFSKVGEIDIERLQKNLNLFWDKLNQDSVTSLEEAVDLFQLH